MQHEPPGKLGARDLKEFVFQHLGAPDRDVSWGPGLGRDFNVVRLDNTMDLLVTTDPLYVHPAFGIEDATWFGFQILLADMLASGIPPSRAIFSLTLPGDVDDETFTRAWRVLHRECDQRGISIVSGHTGRYDGCSFPIIGSGTLLATCKAGEHVCIDRARQGDQVILTGLPAMESYASLLKIDRDTGRDVFGSSWENRARDAWMALSVEPHLDVLRAVALDGDKPLHELVSGIHDVAEGGVTRAMLELCEGTGTGCTLVLDDFPVDDGYATFMDRHFPRPGARWFASGQGGLLVTCRPGDAGRVVEAMLDHDIPAGIIGGLTGTGHGTCYSAGGTRGNIGALPADPFWPAFTRVVAKMEGRP